MTLFEYLAREAKGKNPLRLTGFDTRGSGKGVKEFLIGLYDFLAPAGAPSPEDKAALRSMHGEEKIADELSGYYLAGHLERTYAGMIRHNVRSIVDALR